MATGIYLLRHGETTSGPCFRGSLDDTLTERGWDEMSRGVQGYSRPELILSSPLKRCAEFAGRYAERHQVPLEFEADLQEMHFGAWEGATAEQILAMPGNCLEAFWADPFSVTPPGGEALVDFQRRVLDAWRRVRSRHQRPLWVICHGGTIRTILLSERGLPRDQLMNLEVPHGSMHSIDAV